MKEENGQAKGSSVLPNSSARKNMLDPYHDLATTFFDVADTPEMEKTFLNAAKEGDFAQIESLLKRRNETIFSLDVRDKKTGNNALAWAAKRGHLKIVDLLLRYGADVTLRNHDCQTAVEVASPQIQQLLLTSAGIGGPHRNLRQASWQGDSNLVRKILAETQVDINCRNDEGLTPLLLLTRDVMLFEKIGSKLSADRAYDPHQVIEQLLLHRADPNASDDEGKTALHYVAASKAKVASQLVAKLLEDGSDIESRDRRCFTPIHCASQSGNVDVVMSLLDGGSEANARGYAGTTPLHISAINGHDLVACALLQKGADVTLNDDSGLTAVDVAKTKKVKATLKHAWAEATQSREPRNLAPVREGSARSLNQPTGEVVFDSLVSSSMNLESARLKRPGFSKRFDERGRRSDDLLPVPVEENRINANRSGNHASPRSPKTRRLTPIKAGSPRKTPVTTPPAIGPLGGVKFGPGTKIHDGSNYSRHRPLSDKHQTAGLHKCPSDPGKFPGGGMQIPVTILDLDLDENLQDVKSRKVMHGPSGSSLPSRKGHTRHHSDPNTSACPEESETKGELITREEASSSQTIQIQEPSDVCETPVPLTFVTQMEAIDLHSPECLSPHSSPEPDDGISLVMGSQAPLATLKENFNIEESRVRTSSDSGLAVDASKSSSLTSSGSNSSAGSPRVKEELRSNSTPRERTVLQSSECASRGISVDRSRPKSRGPPTRPKEPPPKPPVAHDIVKVNFVADKTELKTPRNKPVIAANGGFPKKNSTSRNVPIRPTVPPKRPSFGQTAKERQSSSVKVQSGQKPVTKTSPKAPPPRPPKPSANASKILESKVDQKETKPVSFRAMSASSVEPQSTAKPSEHKGPVIQDPFESLRREREEVEEEKPKPANTRTKSALAKKPTPLKKDTTRLTSAGKKKTKAKEPTDAKATLTTTRRKTGKQRKSKKDTMAMTQNENAAFVSGIGWHIEASRDSDIHAVVMQRDDSSGSEEDVPKVAPNYDLVASPMIVRRESMTDKLRRSLELNESLIPGQPVRMEESEEEQGEEQEEENEVAEMMCEEVFFTETEPYEDMLLVAELKARAEEAMDRSKVIPQTVKAIEEFSRSILQEDLTEMLEGGEPMPMRIHVKEASSSSSVANLSLRKPSDEPVLALSAVEETPRSPVHRSSSLCSSPSKTPSAQSSPAHRSSSVHASNLRSTQPPSAPCNVYATQTSPLHRALGQPSTSNQVVVIAKPSSFQSAAKSSSSEPLISKPSSSQPLITKPSSSEPVISKPSSSEPLISNPSTSEPILSNPSTSEPHISKSSSSEPLISKPSSSEPLISNPSTSEPLISNPSTSEPLISKPSSSKPLISKPSSTQSVSSTQPSKSTASKPSSQSEPRSTRPASRATGQSSKSSSAAQTPKAVKQRNSRAPSKKLPRAPRTREQEEQEINHMIDEILKSTPDPTLSLSWRTGRKLGNKMQGMTEEQLAMELRNSQLGATFERIPNDVVKEKKEEVSDLGSFGEEEMATIEKLAHALKNLPLKVTDDSDSETEAVVGKPPKAPKSKAPALYVAKSPRFVRKHDSLQRMEAVPAKEVEDCWSDSEFGSNFSLAADDSLLVPLDRGEVVTSRLGRRNSCSRAPSVMTNETEEVETIQWKRGNMLGKGAYGTVWCGLTNTGGLIAVKQIELNTDNMDRAEMEYEKIQEEVELLKNLNHSNIVGYLGTSLEEHIVSIFMEFVPGGSIANLLARFGALEEEVFCHYTRQILEGVQYLHSNNVIHRDIKGGNIMLMPNSEIKLIDFGCAKRLCLNMSVGGRNKSSSHNRLLKSMRGTPYWMAPEVVKEEGHGTRSDIWSIGCTVFEMATRKPPWSEMPPMAAIFTIGSDSKPLPQLPEKFSPEARQFVTLCLTRDQHKRPSSAQMLNHPFIIKRKKSRIS